MLRIHAHNLHMLWTESVQGNQRPYATVDRESVMDDSVEGPSTTRKQKIEDRGSLKKWSDAATSKNFIFHKHVSLL